MMIETPDGHLQTIDEVEAFVQAILAKLEEIQNKATETQA